MVTTTRSSSEQAEAQATKAPQKIEAGDIRKFFQENGINVSHEYVGMFYAMRDFVKEGRPKNWSETTARMGKYLYDQIMDAEKNHDNKFITMMGEAGINAIKARYGPDAQREQKFELELGGNRYTVTTTGLPAGLTGGNAIDLILDRNNWPYIKSIAITPKGGGEGTVLTGEQARGVELPKLALALFRESRERIDSPEMLARRARLYGELVERYNVEKDPDEKKILATACLEKYAQLQEASARLTGSRAPSTRDQALAIRSIDQNASPQLRAEWCKSTLKSIEENNVEIADTNAVKAGQNLEARKDAWTTNLINLRTNLEALQTARKAIDGLPESAQKKNLQAELNRQLDQLAQNMAVWQNNGRVLYPVGEQARYMAEISKDLETLRSGQPAAPTPAAPPVAVAAVEAPARVAPKTGVPKTTPEIVSPWGPTAGKQKEAVPGAPEIVSPWKKAATPAEELAEARRDLQKLQQQRVALEAEERKARTPAQLADVQNKWRQLAAQAEMLSSRMGFLRIPDAEKTAAYNIGITGRNHESALDTRLRGGAPPVAAPAAVARAAPPVPAAAAREEQDSVDKLRADVNKVNEDKVLRGKNPDPKKLDELRQRADRLSEGPTTAGQRGELLGIRTALLRLSPMPRVEGAPAAVARGPAPKPAAAAKEKAAEQAATLTMEMGNVAVTADNVSDVERKTIPDFERRLARAAGTTEEKKDAREALGRIREAVRTERQRAAAEKAEIAKRTAAEKAATVAAAKLATEEERRKKAEAAEEEKKRKAAAARPPTPAAPVAATRAAGPKAGPRMNVPPGTYNWYVVSLARPKAAVDSNNIVTTRQRQPYDTNKPPAMRTEMLNVPFILTDANGGTHRVLISIPTELLTRKDTDANDVATMLRSAVMDYMNSRPDVPFDRGVQVGKASGTGTAIWQAWNKPIEVEETEISGERPK